MEVPKSYFDDEGLMKPMWIKYPEIPLGSIGWRMGYGQSYWEEFAYWFRNDATATQRKRVEEKYPSKGDWLNPDNIWMVLRQGITPTGDKK